MHLRATHLAILLTLSKKNSLARRANVMTVLFTLIVCAAASSAGEPRKDRHALLVGVTFYENLPRGKHLEGPANDVLAVRKLLIDKFQFHPEQIVILSEQEGQQRGRDFYPTRANIERGFQRLAQTARPGDQVMIHMGGHGSQQPEDKDAPAPEPDGLDEIFLPRTSASGTAQKGPGQRHHRRRTGDLGQGNSRSQGLGVDHV